MNAAARAINEITLFNGHLISMRLSRPMWLMLVLLTGVLTSALAVVYTTNEQRIHVSQLQQFEQQAHQLQLQWGQLLLEQASLATPARVQQWAVDKLNMRLPADKQTFVLHPR